MNANSTVERLLYLYGITRSDQTPMNEIGSAVQAVAHAAIVALVEPVCALEFSPANLDQKLQSIEWVARLARRHETVLEHAMRHGPVVPARLCTLFSDMDSLHLSLAENEERFLAKLQRVQAREEWGLKAYCDEGRLRDVVGLADPKVLVFDADVAKVSPGQAFVLQKRRDARLAKLATERLDVIADAVVETLEHDAVDLRLRPLLSAQAIGRPEPMVLNMAVLVDSAARAAFRDTLVLLSERFEVEGLTIEASGPWPPYSFCDDQGTDSAEDFAELSAAGA